MIRRVMLSLLLLPACVMASGGAWTDKNGGMQLMTRGTSVQSARLFAAATIPAAVVTTVYWQYELVSVAPVGLQVRLCNDQKCVPLHSRSGHTTAFLDVDANSSFFFVYFLDGKGTFHPKLNVVSNQVTVNYRY